MLEFLWHYPMTIEVLTLLRKHQEHGRSLREGKLRAEGSPTPAALSPARHHPIGPNHSGQSWELIIRSTAPDTASTNPGPGLSNQKTSHLQQRFKVQPGGRTRDSIWDRHTYNMAQRLKIQAFRYSASLWLGIMNMLRLAKQRDCPTAGVPTWPSLGKCDSSSALELPMVCRTLL